MQAKITMTPEQQRIKIAEACGWKILKQEVHPTITYQWGLPPGFIHEENKAIIPNYLNDLNAMHEAEKVFSSNQLMHYYFNLRDSFRLPSYMEATAMAITAFRATAAQRAEAFLKTLNLWEE
jgi:hypothetical protein